MDNYDPVIEQIQIAFGDISYPGDNDLVDLSKAGSGLFEYMEAKEAFIGQEWHALTRSFLESHRDSIFFFSPNAFVYYLPAFLIAALQQPDDSDIPDTIVYMLVPPEKPNFRDSFDRWVKLLNNKQRDAIFNFIKTYLTIDPHITNIEYAYEFWKATCQAK